MNSKRLSPGQKPAAISSEFCATYLDNLGEQYFDLGRPEEGLPYYEQSLKIRRELSRTHPENREYTIDFVKCADRAGRPSNATWVNLARHGSCFADAEKFWKNASKSAASRSRPSRFSYAVALN